MELIAFKLCSVCPYERLTLSFVASVHTATELVNRISRLILHSLVMPVNFEDDGDQDVFLFSSTHDVALAAATPLMSAA